MVIRDEAGLGRRRLPREDLRYGGAAVWELGRRLTRPGVVRQDRLPDTGFRCAFSLPRDRYVVVHATEGLGLVSRGEPWLAMDRDVSFAAPAGDRLLVIRAGTLRLQRLDGVTDGSDGPGFACSAATAALVGDDLIVASFPEAGRVRGYTLDGQVVFELGARDGLTEPVGVSAAPDGTGFLVADARRHHVMLFPRPSSGLAPVRIAGESGRAGKRNGQLNAPRFAAFTPSGTVLVTDTKNNRVLEMDGTRLRRSWGVLDSFSPPSCRFWYPSTAVACPDGSLLVAEGRGGRLLLVSPAGDVELLSGSSDVVSTEVIQPRGGHFVSRDRIVVTDCHNDRVLEVSPDGLIHDELPPPGMRGETALDWPRFATRTADGMVVADGRNGRLVWLDENGRVVRHLHEWRSEAAAAAPVAFVDPHHVTFADRDRSSLLVTDSGAGTVVAMDPYGVARAWWQGFDDPHMALAVGADVLVCDTGADRIVRMAVDGGVTWSLQAEHVGTMTGTPMCQPRAIALLSGGRILVVDTGNHRLLLATEDGQVRSLSAATARLGGSLYFPRYIDVDPTGSTAVVSDFDNSRLVFLDVAALLGDSDD